MRGRRPAGPEYVDHLSASEPARQRLKVVLETLAGRLRVQEACQQLGIGEVRFNELRQTVLTAALAALEPKPAGRPKQTAAPVEGQLAALAERVEELTVELHAAQVREEIALALPQAAQAPEAAEKKNDTAEAATPRAVIEPPGATTEHLNRVAEMIELAEAEAERKRRGRRGAGQQPRRQLQQQVRLTAAALGEQLHERDWSATSIGDLLGVNTRTLRHWQWLLHQSRPQALPLGRPLFRSPRTQRQQVLELLYTLGPGLGLPTLRDSFPAMPRNELADLLARYRRAWRQRHHDTLHVLHWTRPGAVWAIDFSEAPTSIDGLYPYLLAVRDLASGQQLLWLPVQHPTAAEAAEALTGLFVLHGAPLVLKSDNGSAFDAGAFQALIHQVGVIPLFSPPYWPRYNGAIEAGIGSLKERTERWASRAGRPAQWTWDDVSAARLEANATARPRGPDQPTPDESWSTRRLLTADERDVFGISVQRQRQVLWQEIVGEPGNQEAAAMERLAIQRALAEGGLLLFRRRRIPSPIGRPETANIP